MFQRAHTSLGNYVKEEATAVDYLKTLAVARLYLDNISNIQASWLTPGHKICQIALRFGGNDVGSILIEEKRRERGRLHEHDERTRTAPPDLRRGLPAREARHPLPHVLSELSFAKRCPPEKSPANFPCNRLLRGV